MSSGSRSGSVFKIWRLFAEGPGVEDGEVLMEERGDPDAASADNFVCVWQMEGVWLDKKGERA
jgi:hypothetical protein